MKKFSVILFILINTHFFAQTPPQLINYQGVARDNAGNPIIGSIGLKFELHQTNSGGTVVFTEVQSATTNAFGIFNVQIGKINQSAFALINWGAADYFLEVSMDPAGGTSYTSIGSQQLVSVPYALYAKSAGNSTSYNAGSNITFTWPPNNPSINSNPNLNLAGNVLSISGSGSPVTLPTSSLTASSNVTVSSTGVNSFNLNVPNYVAGNNIIITPPTSGNNYTINSTATSTTVSVPIVLSINPPHTAVSGINSATINIIAPNLNVTGGGGVVTSNVLPNYSINIPTVVITPTPGGLSLNQNGFTSTVAIGGPWTTSVSTVNLVNGSNNVGIGTTNSTAKLTVTTSLAIDAILAQSNGANGILATTNSSGPTDAAVFGSNSGLGHGLRGETISTNTLSAAVIGVNNGMGNGVLGVTGSVNNAINGVKGINNNFGAGVLGENTSGGVGVRAIVPTNTVTGGSNVALQFDNGHIKSTQINQPTVGTFSAVGGAMSATYTLTNATDVKGSLLAVITTSGMINSGGYLTMKVTFNKAYTVIPTVVVTPTSDQGLMSYFVTNVTPNTFNLTIKNSTAGNISGFSQPYSFNYFVIE